MLCRNGKFYICFSPQIFLLLSSNSRRVIVTLCNLILPTQKRQPAQTIIPGGKMTLEWKRWQSTTMVLSETHTHTVGKTRAFYSSFSVPRIREPWKWFRQFIFTLSCLNSTAGLILPNCLLSHFLRKGFTNPNKYFQMAHNK